METKTGKNHYFKEISVGDQFTWQGQKYVKTEELTTYSRGKINAVILSVPGAGVHVYMDIYSLVVKIKPEPTVLPFNAKLKEELERIDAEAANSRQQMNRRRP